MIQIFSYQAATATAQVVVCTIGGDLSLQDLDRKHFESGIRPAQMRIEQSISCDN